MFPFTTTWADGRRRKRVFRDEFLGSTVADGKLIFFGFVILYYDATTKNMEKARLACGRSKIFVSSRDVDSPKSIEACGSRTSVSLADHTFWSHLPDLNLITLFDASVVLSGC